MNKQETSLTTENGIWLKNIIVEALREVLPEIKVYVLESEITATQNAVKAVVEQASF